MRTEHLSQQFLSEIYATIEKFLWTRPARAILQRLPEGTSQDPNEVWHHLFFRIVFGSCVARLLDARDSIERRRIIYVHCRGHLLNLGRHRQTKIAKAVSVDDAELQLPSVVDNCCDEQLCVAKGLTCHLPSDCRTVADFALDGMSEKELASHCCLTLQTVKQRLRKAGRLLRQFYRSQFM